MSKNNYLAKCKVMKKLYDAGYTTDKKLKTVPSMSYSDVMKFGFNAQELEIFNEIINVTSQKADIFQYLFADSSKPSAVEDN